MAVNDCENIFTLLRFMTVRQRSQKSWCTGHRQSLHWPLTQLSPSQQGLSYICDFGPSFDNAHLRHGASNQLKRRCLKYLIRRRNDERTRSYNTTATNELRSELLVGLRHPDAWCASRASNQPFPSKAFP